MVVLNNFFYYEYLLPNLRQKFFELPCVKLLNFGQPIAFLVRVRHGLVSGADVE